MLYDGRTRYDTAMKDTFCGKHFIEDDKFIFGKTFNN